jgi:tetratricopeptide (TPR) repeat protein
VSPHLGASISGDRNVVIQTAGDHNTISVNAQLRLTLHSPRNRSQIQLNNEIDILKANSEAVPFIGRQSTFESIWRWLRAPANFSIQVLIGRGGSGKTRLGIEALRRLPVELPPEWQGGLIDHDELREVQGQLNLYEFSWRKPTLMVLDYAAPLADALKILVRKLYRSSQVEGSHAIRLLLLERFADPASGWLTEVIDRSFTWDTSAIFEPVIKLPVFGDTAERHELLCETVAAAVKFHPGSNLLVPALGDDPALDRVVGAPELQDPLFVMMTALTAFSTGWPTAVSPGRTDLAIRFAQREAQRISQFAPDSSSADILKHMAAIATLCGGLTSEETIGTCSTEMVEMNAQYPGGAAKLARDLAKALPGDPGVAPVGPDIVAEAFVIDLFQDALKDGSGAVRRSILRNQRTVGFVTRAVIDFQEPESSVPRRWLGDLIELARSTSDATLLFAIDRTIPEATTELRGAAVAVSTGLLDIARAQGGRSSDALNELAKHHMALANRLSDLGRPWDALPHSNDSIEIARKLTAEGGNAFRPTLAMALTNAANILVKVGRPDEAVVSIEEAVSAYHQLAGVRPEAFLPLLATSLSNLPNAYVAAGRAHDALAPVEESVSIYRRLVSSSSDEFLPGLALALGNLANVLMQLTGAEPALARQKRA